MLCSGWLMGFTTEPKQTPVSTQMSLSSATNTKIRQLKYTIVKHAGLELSGGGEVEPPVHVYRCSFLSENWL